jgi:hypothetical protein
LEDIDDNIATLIFDMSPKFLETFSKKLALVQISTLADVKNTELSVLLIFAIGVSIGLRTAQAVLEKEQLERMYQ